MKIEKAIFINRAPFKKVEFDFLESGVNVLSGINGRGKTTVISHIVDAFYEMARKSFINTFEGKENKFYRYSSDLFNYAASSYSLFYARFKEEDKCIDYIDCRGKMTEGEYNEIVLLENKIPYKNINLSLERNNCIKSFHTSKEDEVVEIFNHNILTYFPSYRYEQPGYLNDPYKVNVGFNINSAFSGELPNPIEVVSDLNGLAIWFMDVILDSKLYSNRQASRLLINNLNRIVSASLKSKLGMDTRLGIGPRENTASRIAIAEQNGNLLYPTIFNISSGESALICMFGEILKQANKLEMVMDVPGIVLIDEVDKHLHIRLQKEILPQLFELFPNIQFIVSSHSPFLNMGLADKNINRTRCFDLDNNALECMPVNNQLYSEVYDMFINENNRYAEKLRLMEDKVAALCKPLVITEEKTDIKHILKAKEVLGINLDFDIIDSASQPDGDDNLKKLLNHLAKIKQLHKIIGIFDCDISKTVSEMHPDGNSYKDYGNGVYGFTIPVPEDRVKNGQTGISIEYLYSDAEIKSPVNDYGHRLFFGTEFSRKSMSHNEDNRLTLSKPNGKGEDKILENNGGQAVYDEEDNNCLAKKDDFAEAIKNGFIHISNESWNHFKPIFELLSEIMQK